MKIIKNKSMLQIYENDIEVSDIIPAGTYTIQCSQFTGFYLEETLGMSVKEKVYGVNAKKVEKVLTRFNNNNKSVGVILSGAKGIGKSLFARQVGERAVKEYNLPVLLIDQYLPGMVEFLRKITQPCVLIFDEFDKTFKTIDEEEDTARDPQTKLLSFFDGTSMGTKFLSVITCNELYSLSDYLVNRPGRFHFHLRFEYPTDNEIRKYLVDHLGDNAEIEKVIRFSHAVALNYDCLRAIADELLFGGTFEEAIKDLNIINLKDQNYRFIVYDNLGTVIHTTIEEMDLFNENSKVVISWWDTDSEARIQIIFRAKDTEYHANWLGYRVPADACIINLKDVRSDEQRTVAEKLAQSISYIDLHPVTGSNFQYFV